MLKYIAFIHFAARIQALLLGLTVSVVQILAIHAERSNMNQSYCPYLGVFYIISRTVVGFLLWRSKFCFYSKRSNIPLATFFILISVVTHMYIVHT